MAEQNSTPPGVAPPTSHPKERDKNVAGDVPSSWYLAVKIERDALADESRRLKKALDVIEEALAAVEDVRSAGDVGLPQ